MKTDISFCPLCAGKLDSGNHERYLCDDCETRFLIQIVEEEEEGDEENDDDMDDEEEEEDEEEEDEY